MKKLLTLTAVGLLMASTAYAQSLSKGAVQRLDLDSITLDGTTVTATGEELNILDNSTAFTTSLGGVSLFKELSYTSAELNAGAILLSSAGTGLKNYVHDVKVLGDAAVTTCTAVLLEENGSGDDLVRVPIGVLSTAGEFRYTSSTAYVSFYDDAIGGIATATAVNVDNEGSACAGANNYTIGVTYTVAP